MRHCIYVFMYFLLAYTITNTTEPWLIILNEALAFPYKEFYNSKKAHSLYLPVYILENFPSFLSHVITFNLILAGNI